MHLGIGYRIQRVYRGQVSKGPLKEKWPKMLMESTQNEESENLNYVIIYW